jgi:kynurenine 3-monooxygenase
MMVSGSTFLSIFVAFAAIDCFGSNHCRSPALWSVDAFITSNRMVPLNSQPAAKSMLKELYLASRKLESSDTPLDDLNIAIIGAGPSGLLLAHKVARLGAKVKIFEARSRPQPDSLEQGRAYALGVGIRGRTAIQAVDDGLWNVVEQAGFGSQRFQLHAGPLKMTLRDEQDNVQKSVLLYQTDLCRVLAEELESCYNETHVTLAYSSNVVGVDLDTKQVKIRGLDSIEKETHFDLIVGCDGVNSIVRQELVDFYPAFKSVRTALPGVFKVVQLSAMPPALDPTAVALILPKAGGVTAFVEPTINNTCCILFAGRNETDPLLISKDETELFETMQSRFPILKGANFKSVAIQMAAIEKPSQASSIVCNMYHFNGTVALLGDAAHATGGVSGQGVNSALCDSVALGESLRDNFEHWNKEQSLQNALLDYSRKQVPEGRALYDLSFGPAQQGVLQRVKLMLKNALDFLFQGRFGIGDVPLQTLLTTSTRSFADIRRDREALYSEPFPTQEKWNNKLIGKQ